MTHLITHHDAHNFQSELNQMFELRKQVFVDTYKWDLTCTDGKEIDQFDTPEAYYLIERCSENGDVIGSVRFLPTTTPHLMSEIFPHLCAHDRPEGPDVWEISRLFCSPLVQDRVMRDLVRRRLALSMIEFSLLFGISKLILVTHMFTLNQLVSCPWDVYPLGMPVGKGANQIAAMGMNITPSTLIAMRNHFGMHEPVLQEYQSFTISDAA